MSLEKLHQINRVNLRPNLVIQLSKIRFAINAPECKPTESRRLASLKSKSDDIKNSLRTPFREVIWSTLRCRINILCKLLGGSEALEVQLGAIYTIVDVLDLNGSFSVGENCIGQL